MTYPIAVALALALNTSAVTDQRTTVEHIGQPSINGQRLPFADAVRLGDTLYLSGAIGVGPDGRIPDGIEAQARLAMDHIGGILQRQGLGFGNIVKCTVMLDDMADWPAFNAVYVRYFPEDRFPARSAFGADGLALGALVEVECIAHAGSKSLVPRLK